MANLTLTRQWIENIYQLETTDPVMGGPDGVDNRQAKELGARTNWLKDQVDGINQDRTDYAPKASPAFTGVPTAPTADSGTNNTQIATTEFVKTAIAALVGSAPAALDTLEELAQALAGDANFKATLLAEIGKKANATDFNALYDLFIGIPIPYPLSTVPAGCLAMNGQRFDTHRYPKLAQKYPSGELPDMRGEFIRGWDNGRGVDAGRDLLSWQYGSLLVQEANYPINNVVAQSGNTAENQGWDKTDSSLTNRIKMTTAVADNPTANWFAVPGSFAIDAQIPYVGMARPRNITFNYICLAE